VSLETDNGIVTGTTALSTNTWAHIAVIVDSGRAGKLYINGVYEITNNCYSGTPSPNQLYVGKIRAAPMAGRIANFFCYSADIGVAGVLAQMNQYFPVRTANLNTWLPMVDSVMADNGHDYSGNGYDMTVTGSPTVAGNPPIPWRQGRKKYFIPLGVAASLDQEGFRWRNDDGNETTATWNANQDTDISAGAGINKRLRVIVNATGDPAAKDFLLEGKKSTDSDWIKI
jgi:hypothetical protein